MISINSNTTSLRVRNTLSKTTNKLNTAIERMSSGYRINKAADDAASVLISSGLQSRINALNTTSDTIKTAKTITNTMDSSIAQMISELNRMYELCVDGANDTLTTSQRDAIQNEINSNIDEIYRQKNSTNINGKELFGEAEIYDSEHLSTSDFKDIETEEINGVTYTKGTDKYDGKTYYFVETAEQLQNINNKLDGNFVLMNDIDLSGVEWTALGNATNKYTGIFEGNGYTISNLTIDKAGTDYQGLFGYASGATIQDVTLQNVNVTGKAHTGGLVGRADSGIICNCQVIGGTVTGNGQNAGGLVGCISVTSTISNCYTSGNVTGTGSNVGGFAGTCSGTISNCYATGNVSGKAAVGGFAGAVSGTISNCYATGDVTGNVRVGGFAGSITGTDSETISNSYSTGNATGTQYVGGFIGYRSSALMKNLTNCHSLGNAQGTQYVGGFIGYFVKTTTGTTVNYLQDCTSAGNVTANRSNYGGFIGYSSNTQITDCTLDSSVTCNGTPCTTDIGKNGGIIGGGGTATCDNVTIGDASFDPLEVLGDEWYMAEDGTITLKSFSPINMIKRLTSEWSDLTTETINDVEYVKGTYKKDGKIYYQVETAEQLQNINNKLDGNFMLMNDIDLSGVEWTAIGNDTTAFTGTFDGNEHTISNLNVIKLNNGLFGYNSGSIKNINLDNACIKTSRTCVGVLVGQNSGTIDNCSVTNSTIGILRPSYAGGLVGINSGIISNSNVKNSTVSGSSYVGGLVGSMNGGSVINCSASGTVSGDECTGGLVGKQDEGTITNCYATANVYGTASESNCIGGLVGLSDDIITNSYATGNVSVNVVISDCCVGGLVGGGNGHEIITNCYATGSVTGADYIGGLIGYTEGTITNSYCKDAVGDSGAGEQKDESWFASSDSATALNAGGSEWEYILGKENPTLVSNPQYEKETGMRIQIAFDGEDDMNMYLNNEFELGRMVIDVSTSEKAAESLNEINRMLKICNDQRSLIGCDYNILESVEYSNATSKQNTSEALSTIQDADMAKESSEYTKQQILQEAAASLLVQANQSPTIALQLIYGGI